MNVYGFLFNKLSSQQLQASTKSQDPSIGDSVFQKLLQGNEKANSTENGMNSNDKLMTDIMANEELSLEMSSEELGKLLNGLIESDYELSTEELTFELEQLAPLDESVLQKLQSHADVVPANFLNQEKLTDILTTFREILQGTSSEGELRKIALKVLELLQQWTSIERGTGNEKGVTVVPSNTKEQAVWNELLQNFQRRNQLASQQLYNTNSKVTTTDVMKWMSHALEKHSQIEWTPNQLGTNIQSTMPMTKLEQYVIYVNQNNQAQPVDKQLIEQVQKVINSSRIMSLPNGANQLSIALRPDNLGEMMIKLTQINGEMTVKILVSSQATKELLESNMNQLKNMFSPHQVSIEKQEVTNVPQGQSLQKDQGGQTSREQQQQSNQSSSEQQEQSKDVDFESTFKELLVNEGV